MLCVCPRVCVAGVPVCLCDFVRLCLCASVRVLPVCICCSCCSFVPCVLFASLSVCDNGVCRTVQATLTALLGENYMVDSVRLRAEQPYSMALSSSLIQAHLRPGGLHLNHFFFK